MEALRRPRSRDEVADLPLLTAHVAGEPLSALAELLILDAGLSLSYPPDLAQTPVYVAWEQREALPALRALAEQLGLIAIVRGDTEVELAPERASDVEIAALAAVYEDPIQVQAIASQLLSSVGSAEVLGNLVVVADVPDRLSKIESLAEVLSAERSQWLIEARYIEVSQAWDRRIGAEVRASGGLSLTFSAEDLLDPIRGGSLVVELLAEAEQGTRDARQIATTRVYCLDGRTARSDYGQRTPIPVRSVSPEGTVTTVRYDYVDTGVILDVSLRELPSGSAMISVAPEISSVIGQVDSAPITARSRVQSDAILESGGVLLLGGLDLDDSSESVNGALGYRRRDAHSSRSVVVVLRAERVRGASASGTEVVPSGG